MAELGALLARARASDVPQDSSGETPDRLQSQFASSLSAATSLDGWIACPYIARPISQPNGFRWRSFLDWPAVLRRSPDVAQGCGETGFALGVSNRSAGRGPRGGGG